MSLFDVIKYPLSNPPTREQIETLPIYVVRQFYWNANEWSDKELRNHLYNQTIALHEVGEYSDLKRPTEMYLNQINNIKQLLNEYNDNL